MAWTFVILLEESWNAFEENKPEELLALTLTMAQEIGARNRYHEMIISGLARIHVEQSRVDEFVDWAEQLESPQSTALAYVSLLVAISRSD